MLYVIVLKSYSFRITPQLPHSCHTVTPQLTFLCALPQQVPYKHPTSNPTSLPYKLTGKKSLTIRIYTQVTRT